MGYEHSYRGRQCGFNKKHQSTIYRITFSHLHCTAGSSRSFTAHRKGAGLCCGSRLRKGEVFAYVGLPQNLKDLKEDHPLDTRREPSALYCWIFEILYCNPKGRRALLRIPSTEGRSVCLCGAPSKPKGPTRTEGSGPGSSMSLTAIRKDAGLFCRSFR